MRINQSPCIRPRHWVIPPFLLPIPTVKFSPLDNKRRSRTRDGKKWKRSDSSDYDSVELTIPLALIFDFR